MGTDNRILHLYTTARKKELAGGDPYVVYLEMMNMMIKEGFKNAENDEIIDTWAKNHELYLCQLPTQYLDKPPSVEDYHNLDNSSKAKAIDKMLLYKLVCKQRENAKRENFVRRFFIVVGIVFGFSLYLLLDWLNTFKGWERLWVIIICAPVGILSIVTPLAIMEEYKYWKESSIQKKVADKA